MKIGDSGDAFEAWEMGGTFHSACISGGEVIATVTHREFWDYPDTLYKMIDAAWRTDQEDCAMLEWIRTEGEAEGWKRVRRWDGLEVAQAHRVVANAKARNLHRQLLYAGVVIAILFIVAVAK